MQKKHCKTLSKVELLGQFLEIISFGDVFAIMSLAKMKYTLKDENVTSVHCIVCQIAM